MLFVSYRIMRLFCAIYASPNHHPAPRGITKKNKICTRFEKNSNFPYVLVLAGLCGLIPRGAGVNVKISKSGRPKVCSKKKIARVPPLQKWWFFKNFGHFLAKFEQNRILRWWNNGTLHVVRVPDLKKGPAMVVELFEISNNFKRQIV